MELENQVREGLIQRKADELYKQTQEPKYKDMAKNILKTIFNSMSGVLGEEDSEDSEIEGQIEILLSNTEQLKQQVYQDAQQEYMSREQWDVKFKELYIMLNEDSDFGDKAMSELKKANEGIYEFIELQDRVVKGLIEIAEREGIEKALTDKAQYEVTRLIFPNKEDYIAYQMNGMQAVKEYLTNIQNAMMMDGEKGQIIGAMFEGMQKAMEGMQELREQTVKDKIIEKAQKIYGA